MADFLQRSYVRDKHGPRPIDGTTARNGLRQHKDVDERAQHRRSKRDSSHRSSKKESSHRRKQSTAPTTNIPFAEPPSFELDFMGQPPRIIALGMTIDMSIMMSMRLSPYNRKMHPDHIDTSQLFGMVSLVAETKEGERVPLEANILTGQKVFDSPHAIPQHIAGQLASSDPHRMALGYFSFPGLLIRQAGTYRVRTSLIQMDASGGTNVLAVDSDLMKVERRNTATPRRHQRLYY